MFRKDNNDNFQLTGLGREAAIFGEHRYFHEDCQSFIPDYDAQLCIKEGSTVSTVTFRDGTSYDTIQNPKPAKDYALTTALPTAMVPVKQAPTVEEPTVLKFGKKFTEAQAMQIDKYIREKFHGVFP